MLISNIYLPRSQAVGVCVCVCMGGGGRGGVEPGTRLATTDTSPYNRQVTFHHLGEVINGRTQWDLASPLLKVFM